MTQLTESEHKAQMADMAQLDEYRDLGYGLSGDMGEKKMFKSIN